MAVIASSCQDEELGEAVETAQKRCRALGGSATVAAAGLFTGNRAGSPAERLEEVRRCEDGLRRVAQVRKTFCMEMRQLQNKAEKDAYQQKLREYDKVIQECKTEVKWAKTEQNRKALLADAKDRDTKAVTRDGLLAAAQQTQVKTKDAANRILGKIEDTKQVGEGIVVNLDEQTQQLRRIGEDLSEMDNALNRADLVLRSFMKRMMTDKLICCFAVLLIVGLLVIIIYSSVKPDSEIGQAVPDVARPPAIGGGGTLRRVLHA